MGDGESALREMRDRPADLVVLDLMLPGIDGIEVPTAARERRHPCGHAHPALGEEDRTGWWASGGRGDDHVTKPLQPRGRPPRRLGAAPHPRPRRPHVGWSTVTWSSTRPRTPPCGAASGSPLTGREFDLLRFLLVIRAPRSRARPAPSGLGLVRIGDQSTVIVHVR